MILFLFPITGLWHVDTLCITPFIMMLIALSSTILLHHGLLFIWCYLLGSHNIKWLRPTDTAVIWNETRDIEDMVNAKSYEMLFNGTCLSFIVRFSQANRSIELSFGNSTKLFMVNLVERIDSERVHDKGKF